MLEERRQGIRHYFISYHPQWNKKQSLIEQQNRTKKANFIKKRRKTKHRPVRDSISSLLTQLSTALSPSQQTQQQQQYVHTAYRITLKATAAAASSYVSFNLDREKPFRQIIIILSSSSTFIRQPNVSTYWIARIALLIVSASAAHSYGNRIARITLLTDQQQHQP